MAHAEFDKWFAEQKKDGLVDIKLSISPSQSLTVDDVKDVILEAKAAVARGEQRAFPEPAPIPEDSITRTLRGISLKS